MSPRDNAASTRWKESLANSRTRRIQARRQRRNRRSVKTLVIVGAGTLTLAAGTALATNGGSSPAATAAAARASKGASVLKRGARGPEVRVLQRALRIKKVDGVFGVHTERAVRRFQKRHRLTVDGAAGTRTLAKLRIGKRLAQIRARAVIAGGVSVPEVLRQIAQCESGGNPSAVSPDGLYGGKYQFADATWRAMGGKGKPAKASEAEQDRIAILLYQRSGTSPWANCAP